MTILDTFTPTTDPRWTLAVDGFDRGLEKSIESVMALVNGYCGTRGAIEEGSSASHPSTFVAGVFNQPEKPQDTALEAPIPEIVVSPNWSKLRIAVAGQELNLDSAELLEQRRTLDIRQGVLLREWRVRDNAGQITRLASLRFASLHDRHTLAQVLTFTPENYSGAVEIESLVDGLVANEHDTRHLEPAGAREIPAGLLLSMRTTEGTYTLAFAAQATLADSAGAALPSEPTVGDTVVGQRFSFQAEQDQTYTLTKLVAIFTNRDGERPEEAAATKLRESAAEGVASLLERHREAWAMRWRDSDAEIAGDEEVQREVRWAIYHLIGAAWDGDEKSSVGARSITGERYRGHVFWDTETFVWPFFCYTEPQTARSLLMYRYHTLNGARNKAKSLGYQGALYAWESTDDGEETTPPFIRLPNGVRQEILTGVQEHHLASDIAYAVLQYRQATNDDQFFFEYGAEMLLEIARFWASRVEMGPEGRYHINTVIGPDEYHEYTDDGAYTNVMAQYTLRRALDAAAELQGRQPERWQELISRLRISVDELGQWQRVADGMTVLFDPQTGLFEQFQGYHNREEVDLAGHDMSIETMDIVLGWEHLQKTKVLKQADVVMLIFLLWEQFDEKVPTANFRYYEPRTSHDSSLSASFHALVAARLGDLEMGERYLRKAARIDLDFGRKGWSGAGGGVHIAALGGIWQALAFGFLGMRPQENGLRFHANIPANWGSLRMNITYQGARLRVTGTPDSKIAIDHEGGAPINIAIGEAAWQPLAAGERAE
ncbi:MAG: glycoside hydrolase family 65 protein [Roseiflexaceae bacterium]|nr:glycoside hydrolase family 65 protein [Roseiflexaceae bacterium]